MFTNHTCPTVLAGPAGQLITVSSSQSAHPLGSWETAEKPTESMPVDRPAGRIFEQPKQEMPGVGQYSRKLQQTQVYACRCLTKLTAELDEVLPDTGHCIVAPCWCPSIASVARTVTD